MDLAAFSRTLIYSRTAPPGAIVRDMRALRQIDRFSEHRQAIWGWMSGIGLVATVVLGPVGFFVGMSTESLLIAGVALLFPLVFTSISIAIRSRYKRLNLDNRRYELVTRLMRYLSADMAAGQPIDVTIDLRELDHGDKHTGEGASNGWKIRYYKDPWLQVQGRFVDGTSFVIQLVQLLQKRSKWKRSASGKMKQKTKRKGKAVAVVRLSAKPDKYPRLSRVAGDAHQAVQLPGHAALGDLVIDGHRLTIKSTIIERWTDGEEDGEHSGSQAIAMMLLSLYQVLNLAKAIDKREQAA